LFCVSSICTNTGLVQLQSRFSTGTYSLTAVISHPAVQFLLQPTAYLASSEYAPTIPTETGPTDAPGLLSTPYWSCSTCRSIWDLFQCGVHVPIRSKRAGQGSTNISIMSLIMSATNFPAQTVRYNKVGVSPIVWRHSWPDSIIYCWKTGLSSS